MASREDSDSTEHRRTLSKFRRKCLSKLHITRQDEPYDSEENTSEKAGDDRIEMDVGNLKTSRKQSLTELKEAHVFAYTSKENAVEAALEHTKEVLETSTAQLSEKRNPETTISRIRYAFSHSFAAVEAITQLTGLGVEVAAVVSRVSSAENSLDFYAYTYNPVCPSRISRIRDHQRFHVAVEGK